MNQKVCICGAALAAVSIATGANAQNADEHHVLDEIIVTATPLARSVEELAQPTDIVTGDELARQQGESIGETVAGQPGVTGSYFGPVASRPVIRGQSGERVRVLSNSLDALDASALSEDHAVSIDSILAERVEVVRGPATLLYGSGAAGGLVNIVDSRIREQPLDVSFLGTVSLGYSSATDKKSAAAKLAFGNESVVGHVDAFRRDTGNVSIPGYAESPLLRAIEGEDGGAYGQLENTSSKTSGAAAATSFFGERGYIGAAISQYDSSYGIPGHHQEEDATATDEQVRISLAQSRFDVSGQLHLNGPIEHIKMRLASNDYAHTELEGAEIGTEFDTRGGDARFEFKHRKMARLEGAIGLQYKSIDFTATGDEAFVPSSKTSQLSLFVFEELPINDPVTLQMSARAEYQQLITANLPDHNDTAFGASIGIIWTATDHLTVSTNLALTERHPNATELYADGAHLAVQRYERGSVVLGDGVLDKELSTNLDLTLRGRYARSEFSITTFINDVDDYILLARTTEIRDELPVFDYAQARVRLSGFEAEWLLDLYESERGHLHTRVFSDFVRGTQTSGGRLPRIPPLRVGAGMHFSNDQLDVGVKAIFHNRQNKTAINELPSSSYTLLETELTYKWSDPDLMLFLRGTNLTNEDARRHTSPLKEIAPLPGRSVHAGLRWYF